MGIKIFFSNKMGQIGLSKPNPFKAHIMFKGALSNSGHIYLDPARPSFGPLNTPSHVPTGPRNVKVGFVWAT